MVMEMAAAPAPDVRKTLVYHFQRIGKARQGDDGGAVLVVVEDGNIAALLEFALDLKAAGCGDILQVHAAEGAGQQGHRIDDVIHVVAADAKRNGVHTAEGLEEDAFALHHRHTGLRTDVSQSQHSAAVRDYSHGVPPTGELIALADILLNFQAGLSDTRRIGQRQGLLGANLRPGGDFQLAFPLIVQSQGFLCVIHCSGSFRM